MSSRQAGVPLIQQAPKSKVQQSIARLADDLCGKVKKLVAAAPPPARAAGGSADSRSQSRGGGVLVIRISKVSEKRTHESTVTRSANTNSFGGSSHAPTGLGGERQSSKSFDELKRLIHGKLVDKLDLSKVSDLQGDTFAARSAWSSNGFAIPKTRSSTGWIASA